MPERANAGVGPDGAPAATRLVAVAYAPFLVLAGELDQMVTVDVVREYRDGD